MASNRLQGELLLTALNAGRLQSPRQAPELYKELALHSDGQTPRFAIIPESFTLKLLKQGHLDPDKASIVQRVLSQKLWKFSEGQVTAEQLKKTYHNQTQCSECQKMGILDQELKEWMDHLCQFRV